MINKIWTLVRTNLKYLTEPHDLFHSPTWGECGGSVSNYNASNF